MEKKRDLFDLMQDFTPEDGLLVDECERTAIERVKRRVLKRKGAGFMRLRVVKRVAAAVLAFVLIAGGAIGVDAATGGHVMKKVKESFSVTIEKPDGTKKELGVDKVERVKTDDGSVFLIKTATEKLKDGAITYIEIDEGKEQNKNKSNKSNKSKK